MPPYTSQYTLWSYDIEQTTWNQFDVTLNSPERPNSGASTEATDIGQAFYVGGKLDNGSSFSTQLLGDKTQYLGGMVVLDLATQTSQNFSVNISGSNPRIGAQLQYVPQFGAKGILAYFGGSSKRSGELSSNGGTLVNHIPPIVSSSYLHS